MKKMFAFIIILLTIVSQVDAQKYNRKHFERFPDCAEVIQHFYENNHDALKPQKGRYGFEKRQDGWYACLHEDYNNYGKATKEVLIWDAKSKKYLQEDNEALTTANQQGLASIISDHNLFEYKLLPVCGYRNAATDVIELLKSIKNPNDRELEALARAYDKASGYLIEFNTLQTSVYDSTLDAKVFSTETLTEYVELAKESLANYKKLLQQNPTYSTIVGDISTKYAHETMSFYSNLEMIEQGDLAKEFLDLVEYNDFLLASAKNYLRSCPPNAVLVTWGDSDYYPLCYVQEKLGFRKDVTILNKSLMVLARHINYISHTLPAKKRVKISMNLDFYKGALNNYIFVTKDLSELDYTVFTQKMNENPAQYIHYDIENIPIYKLPSPNIILGKKEQLLLEIKDSYLIKDELFLLDIINTNWRKRPICLTTGVALSHLAYLKDYLVQRGEIYELTKEITKDKDIYGQAINIKASDALILKEFEFEPYTLEQSFSTEYFIHNMHYAKIYAALVKHHIEAGNTTIAMNILEKMYQQLPPNTTALELFHLEIAKYYAEIKPTHKRIKEYVEAYAKQLQMAIDKWEQGDEIVRVHLSFNLRDFDHLAMTLIESCEGYNFEKLSVKYKEQFEKYLPKK